LSQGAVTDTSNCLEQKPIDYANMKGLNEITSLLIDFGAKTNAIEEEPIRANKPAEAEDFRKLIKNVLLHK